MRCCRVNDLVCCTDVDGYITVESSKYLEPAGMFLGDYNTVGICEAFGIYFSAGKDGVIMSYYDKASEDFIELAFIDIEEWFLSDVDDYNIAVVKAIPITIEKVYIMTIAYINGDIIYNSKIINMFSLLANSEANLLSKRKFKKDYNINLGKNKELYSTIREETKRINPDEAKIVVMREIRDDLENIFSTVLIDFIECRVKVLYSDIDKELKGVLHMLSSDGKKVYIKKIFLGANINTGTSIQEIYELKNSVGFGPKYAFVNYSIDNPLFSGKSEVNKNEYGMLYGDNIKYTFPLNREVQFFGYNSDNNKNSFIIVCPGKLREKKIEIVGEILNQFVLCNWFKFNTGGVITNNSSSRSGTIDGIETIISFELLYKHE